MESLSRELWLLGIVGILAIAGLTIALARLRRRFARLAIGLRVLADRTGIPRPPDSRPEAIVSRIGVELANQRGRLEVAEGRFHALLDQLADGVLIADPGGTVTLANPAIARILGRPVEQIVGHWLAEVVWDAELAELVQRAQADPETGGDLMTLVERAIPRRVWRAYARRLPGSGQILVVIQDLTQMRRLETVRRDFLANTSHELRTPIAAIQALAEALEDGALDDPEVARDFVGRIRREADALYQLVEELLQLARIESGQAGLELRPLDLAEVIDRVTARLTPLAERAEVALAAETPPGLPPARADAERIGQVLANLIHNAIKFTPAGGRVTVSVERADDLLRIAVVDTGIGLSAEEVERIFERFYKTDRARATGGTGLGLAIAKHLVQAHNGRIEVHSPGPGRGATFTVSLPIAE